MRKISNNDLPLIIIVVVVISLAYGMLNMADKRTAGEKISDAVEELDHGVEKAQRQMKDRTPADKLGDAVDDARDKVRENATP